MDWPVKETEPRLKKNNGNKNKGMTIFPKYTYTHTHTHTQKLSNIMKGFWINVAQMNPCTSSVLLNDGADAGWPHRIIV